MICAVLRASWGLSEGGWLVPQKDVLEAEVKADVEQVQQDVEENLEEQVTHRQHRL